MSISSSAGFNLNSAEINLKFSHIEEVLKASLPQQWKIDRSKIRTIITGIPALPPEKISSLIQLVIESLKNQNIEIHRDIYFDLAQSEIFNLKLESLPKKFRRALPLELKIEIARNSIEKNSKIHSRNKEIFSQNIQNYAIDANTPGGQAALIEIAKLAAQKDGWGTSEFIANYGIDPNTLQGQKGLIEIAKLAAQQNGRYTSKYIQNYKIQGQTALIEIAKLASQQDGGYTSLFIKNYGIDPNNQLALIEIAKLASQKDPFCIFSAYIQEYGIRANTSEGQAALIEIAKLAAQKNGEEVSNYIKNYGIPTNTPEGQAVLIEIAKIAAGQNGPGTSQFINNYCIDANTPEGQKGLIEIAKLAAQQGSQTIACIENYGINANTSEGQVALMEIAKLAITQNVEALCWIKKRFIENDVFCSETPTGQSNLTELIKFAAQHNSIFTFKKYPRDYLNFETEEGAKTCLMVCLLYLRSLHFVGNNEEDKKTIDEAIEEIRKQLAIFKKINEFGPLLKMIQEMTEECMATLCKSIWPETFVLESSKKSKSKTKIAAKVSVADWIQSLMDQIRHIEKGHMTLEEWSSVKSNAQIWLITTLGLLSLENIAVEEMQDYILPIVEAALKLKDPELRNELANHLVFNFVNFNQSQFSSDLTQFQVNKEIYKNLAPKPMEILSCCLLSLLAQQGVDIKSSFYYLQHTRYLKEAHFANRLLRFLDVLYKQHDLSALDKTNLLTIAFGDFPPKNSTNEKKRILWIFASVMGILELKQADKLKHKAITTQRSIEAIFSEAFLKVLPIRKGIDNLALKLEEIFEKFRDPQMILIYALQLYSRADQETLGAVARCLESVIDNTFLEERYKNSDHLTTVFTIRPDLEVLWKKGEERDLELHFEEFSFPSAQSGSFSHKISEFQQPLLNFFRDKHVPREFYPFLSKYLDLEKNDVARQEEVKQKLTQEIDGSSEEAQRKHLIFQWTLIALLNTPMDSARLLEEAVNLLPESSDKWYSMQFDADIQGLLKSSKENKKILGKNPYHKWKITDTDDLVDLFSCGTEVVGSCQNIHQIAAKYNQCLMSYVLDPKNRLLAIKDETGKIKARSIVRLLMNAETKEPVLFLERIYPAIHSPELELAIVTMAKIRSRTLGIPLLCCGTEKIGIPYGAKLLSLGSKAPYEYVDANGLGITDGKFIISYSQIIE
jgi:hypothetical protein